MGIELYSQILSLNNARRCRRSKSQLVPSGAKHLSTGISERALLCKQIDSFDFFVCWPRTQFNIRFHYPEIRENIIKPGSWWKRYSTFPRSILLFAMVPLRVFGAIRIRTYSPTSSLFIHPSVPLRYSSPQKTQVGQGRLEMKVWQPIQKLSTGHLIWILFAVPTSGLYVWLQPLLRTVSCLPAFLQVKRLRCRDCPSLLRTFPSSLRDFGHKFLNVRNERNKS